SFVTLLAVRAYDSQRSPPLELWHTYVPHEMTTEQIEKSDWARYVAMEQRLFDGLRAAVTDKLGPRSRHRAQRCFSGSPLYPGRLKRDWNRSYIMQPAAAPVGAVVLLHGLTDSPYSLRHVAQRYRDHGFVAVAIRLPGHGTVPSGLTEIEWEQWMA